MQSQFTTALICCWCSVYVYVVSSGLIWNTHTHPWVFVLNENLILILTVWKKINTYSHTLLSDWVLSPLWCWLSSTKLYTPFLKQTDTQEPPQSKLYEIRRLTYVCSCNRAIQNLQRFCIAQLWTTIIGSQLIMVGWIISNKGEIWACDKFQDFS